MRADDEGVGIVISHKSGIRLASSSLVGHVGGGSGRRLEHIGGREVNEVGQQDRFSHDVVPFFQLRRHIERGRAHGLDTEHVNCVRHRRESFACHAIDLVIVERDRNVPLEPIAENEVVGVVAANGVVACAVILGDDFGEIVAALLLPQGEVGGVGIEVADEFRVVLQ